MIFLFSILDDAWVQHAKSRMPDRLSLQHTPTMGLGVVASESISDGDTIATDRPICFVLSPSSNDRRCHGCLASSSELYPCICGWTHACEACRSIQHTFHTSDECRIFQSEGNSHHGKCTNIACIIFSN